MPSSLSHGMVAVAIGTAVAPRALLRPFLVAGTIAAVTPDLDAIGRWIGGGDVEWLGGHRGFTHSLPFAVLAGCVAAAGTIHDRRWSGYRLRFALFVAAAVGAHGALDAFTSIGATTSPVQFFSPFSDRGYVSPWQPIHGPFTELFYCLLPLIAVTRVICQLRRIAWPHRQSKTLTTLLSAADKQLP
jgi:membrane-bound metal-dependent hydrolase YbcI (DUF457 family)